MFLFEKKKTEVYTVRGLVHGAFDTMKYNICVCHIVLFLLFINDL